MTLKGLSECYFEVRDWVVSLAREQPEVVLP